MRSRPASGLSNFYPRPPRGGRLTTASFCTHATNFYPRPPRGGRLISLSIVMAAEIFLSTPSARRATRPEWRQGQGLQISIHALREEGDPKGNGHGLLPERFLSTPSARRATGSTTSTSGAFTIFLSTPSARRATPAFSDHFGDCGDFYPRPPRGGRPFRSAFSYVEP